MPSPAKVSAGRSAAACLKHACCWCWRWVTCRTQRHGACCVRCVNKRFMCCVWTREVSSSYLNASAVVSDCRVKCVLVWLCCGKSVCNGTIYRTKQRGHHASSIKQKPELWVDMGSLMNYKYRWHRVFRHLVKTEHQTARQMLMPIIDPTELFHS